MERFALLDRHYASDIERLRAIEEGGTLFNVLGSSVCPLCGAEPAHHRANADCDGNIDAVVEAARKEIAKIEVLRAELVVTVKDLRREVTSFDRRMPAVAAELEEIAVSVDRLISPKLAKLRASYSEFADKRGAVREALTLFGTVQDIERRKAELEATDETRKPGGVSSGDVPTASAEQFALAVQGILAEWHFPEEGRVIFESKTRDLAIGGKPRSAFGKGLRAVTHAAFTLGLLSYCRANQTPHPGFVVLDSPLLAYRKPEGKEDDLRGTDLNERFYAYLKALRGDQQVIIVENSDPPADIKSLDQVTMFSKNPHSGRYGFFPVSGDGGRANEQVEE